MLVVDVQVLLQYRGLDASVACCCPPQSRRSHYSWFVSCGTDQWNGETQPTGFFGFCFLRVFTHNCCHIFDTYFLMINFTSFTSCAPTLDIKCFPWNVARFACYQLHHFPLFLQAPTWSLCCSLLFCVLNNTVLISNTMPPLAWSYSCHLGVPPLVPKNHYKLHVALICHSISSKEPIKLSKATLTSSLGAMEPSV